MENISSKILAIQSELEEISDAEFSDQSDQEIIENRKKRTVAFSSLHPRPTPYAHLGSFLSTGVHAKAMDEVRRQFAIKHDLPHVEELPHYAAHVAGLRGCVGVIGVPAKTWRIYFGPREKRRLFFMDGTNPNEFLKIFKELHRIESESTKSDVSLRNDAALTSQELLECTFEDDNCTINLTGPLQDDTGVLYLRFFSKRFFHALVVNLREFEVIDIEEALTEVKLGLLAADERKHRFQMEPGELSAADKQPARPSTVAKFDEINLVAKPKRKRRVKAWEGLVRRKETHTARK